MTTPPDPYALITRRKAEIDRCDHELRELAEALEDAEAEWHQVEFTYMPTVICGECGGRGSVENGVFGATECFGCGGARVVQHPDPVRARATLGPDFAPARRLIDHARQAIIQHQRWLPKAERAIYDGTPLPDDPALPLSVHVSAIQSTINSQTKRVKAIMGGRLPAAPGDVLPGEPHLELDDGEA